MFDSLICISLFERTLVVSLSLITVIFSSWSTYNSDNHQVTLKYLKDTEVSIHNILIMVGDFNIRDRKLNPSYLFYLSHSDSLDLKLSSLVYQVSTQYINNPNSSNLVINLIFVHPNLVKIDNHYILSEI